MSCKACQNLFGPIPDAAFAGTDWFSTEGNPSFSVFAFSVTSVCPSVQ